MNHGKVVITALLTMVLLVLCTCSDSDNVVSSDPTDEPNLIDDLATGFADFNSVIIGWSAPAGALEYDIRYSTSIIDTSNWVSAIQVANEPIPLSHGEAEIFQIASLDGNTDYFIAMKFRVDSTNWSTLSNVATCYTPLYVINDLATGLAGFNSVIIGWSAPDGALEYDIRYSSSLIDASNWASAIQVAIEPIPQSQGETEIFHISHLNDTTDYYVAVKFRIDSTEWSPLSNVADFYTSLFDSRGKILFSSYVSGIMQLFIIDSDGSNLKQLTTGYIDYGSPTWTYDGTGIVSIQRHNNSAHIVALDIRTGSKDSLNETTDLTWSPSCSPVSPKIAMVHIPPGKSGMVVLTMNLNGSDRRQITNFGDSTDCHKPSWSWDGSTIIFEQDHHYDTSRSVYTVGSDGSNLTLLMADTLGNNYKLSPDGSKIACTGYLQGNEEIAVMDIDGSNVINLTNNVGEDRSPSWSPDGTKIVFSSNRDGDKEIYVMNSDGSNVIQITNNAVDDYSPSWSPVL